MRRRRVLRVGVAAAVSLLSVVALPTASHATSLGYTITDVHHPSSVVTGSTYTITAKVVDSGGHPVAGTDVYVAVAAPATSCAPAVCITDAYDYGSTNAHGIFSYPATPSALDAAYALYPEDDSFQPDLTGAVSFSVHTHNVYPWAGAKSAKVANLVSTSIALSSKRTTIATGAGSATPQTQIRRGHRPWRTATKGPTSGLLAGLTPYFQTKLPIVAASKPGHYSVRVIDNGGSYEDSTSSTPVSLIVTKRHTPAWLARTNHYRHSVGLQPMFESKQFDRDDTLHAKWIARNRTLCHCEPKGSPGYSKRGNKGGANSVIELGVGNPVGAVDLWMGAPFHATCLLNGATSIGGFGVVSDAAAEWCLPSQQVFDAATKDGNLSPGSGRSLTFPSHRMTVPTSLLTNLGESPDPRTSCPGHWNSWSVPVLFRVQPPKGDPKLKHVKATLKRGHHRVGPECLFSGSTFKADNSYDAYLVQQILAEGPWVILLVRPSLHRGATYHATLKDGHYKQSTTFTIAH